MTAIPPGSTVNATTFVDFIKTTGNRWRCLRTAPIKLRQLLWQMDNAKPHTAATVSEFLEKQHITKIFQSPYSPDLNLCDRFLFPWLKSELRKHVFTNYLQVQNVALRVLRQFTEESLSNEVDKLLSHCQAVIDASGEYITN